jgi:hypothetical protein
MMLVQTNTGQSHADDKALSSVNHFNNVVNESINNPGDNFLLLSILPYNMNRLSSGSCMESTTIEQQLHSRDRANRVSVSRTLTVHCGVS